MIARPKCLKHGFTLTELLVVVAVVSIVLALLAPALQHARQKARRVQCSNNLKQIALALHNYHEVHGTFPPAWTNHYPQAGPVPRFGWTSFLLPFLEEAPIYQQLDFRKPIPPPDELLQTQLPVFRCPSDPTPSVNTLRGNYGTSNYSGNFGSVSPPRWLPGGLARWWPGRAPTPTQTDGIFCLNSRVRVREIIDGTSNTVMVGERSVTSGAGIWVGVQGNEFEDDQVTDCSPGNEINSGFTAFSSRHAGGAHFAICDGSVRFISEHVESRAGTGADMGTYQKLSNCHDRQPVGDF